MDLNEAIKEGRKEIDRETEMRERIFMEAIKHLIAKHGLPDNNGKLLRAGHDHATTAYIFAHQAAGRFCALEGIYESDEPIEPANPD